MLINNLKILNETVLTSLNETDEKTVIKNFTDLGVKILGANFGFVWMFSNKTSKFELAYKSPNLPYEPRLPRRRGLNSRVIKKVKPDFMSRLKKEDDEYDVSQYMKSFAIIPIAYQKNIYGNIVICFKDIEKFPKEKKMLCSLIGSNVAQVLTILRDVHELSKLNRTLKVLGKCNQALIDSKSEKSYLRKVSQIIVKDCGHKLARITYTNNEKGYVPRGKFIAIPLKGQSKIYGTITIYSGTVEPFTKDETRLLSELAQIIGRGIETFRIQSERKESDRIVVENEEFRRKIEEERSRTEFLADAMHEIRTPIAIIRGNVDLALYPSKGALRAADALVSVDTEVKHLTDILHELSILTMTGSEVRRRMMTMNIELPKLIKTIAKRWEVLANSKSISIEIQNIPSVTVLGDESYLDKLFTNIVKNAINYGKNNGRICVSGKVESQMVKIEISDDGIGIGREDIDHIFERFYRADRSRFKDENQTGLGLAIAKWITEVHGGKLTVVSTLGQGSTFTVSLPIVG